MRFHGGAECIFMVSAILPLAMAQSSTEVSGPRLGYAVDELRKTLRPIHGIPGAAHAGPPLDLTFDQIALAPASDYALLSRDGETWWVSLESLEHKAIAVEAWTRAIFSPKGRAAALWHSEGRRITVLSGLPHEPVISRVADLSWLERDPEFFAVTDSAGEIFVSAPLEEETVVFLLPESGVPVRVASFPGISALTLMPEALWLVEGAEGRVAAIREASGWSEVEIVAQLPPDAGKPTGIALPAPADRLLLVNPEARMAGVLTLSSGAFSAVPCACEPNVLEPMRDASVYRITGIGAGAMWMLDAGRADPAVTFVPPPAEETTPARVEDEP